MEKNASALLEYYRLRGDITDTELDALISGDFFRDPARRMRLLEILPENEQRRKVEEAYASYTGSIYFDLNSDGYFEELHLYEFGSAGWNEYRRKSGRRNRGDADF